MTSEAKEPTEHMKDEASWALNSTDVWSRTDGAGRVELEQAVAAAIDAAVQAERERLRLVVTETNDALLELNHGDHEEIIECHADTLPELYREMAIAVEKAIDILQVEIHAMIDPPATRDQEDAEHPESETT